MRINFDANFFTKKYCRLIEVVYNKAREITAIPTETEVNVIFVGNREIKNINAEFRNVDAVTDVISFPNLNIDGKGVIEKEISLDKFKSDINPETNNIILGSVYICVARAKKQAKDYGHSVNREMAYLALHGLLHLLGYDHINDSDKVVMRMREEQILLECKLER